LTSQPDQAQIKPLGGWRQRISTTFETQPVEQGLFSFGEISEPWRSPLFGERLCLNSPGGSIVEGLRIFEGIWNTGVVTVVAPDMRCESACALAFLGGGSFEGARGTRFSRRYIDPGANLGFHSPGLSLQDRATFSEAEVTSAFNTAIRVSALIMSMLDITQHDVRPINTYLVRQILSTPPTEIYLVDSVTDAALFDIDVLGIGGTTFGEDEVSNICDAAYLREFGLTYIGASVADLFHEESNFIQSRAISAALDEDASWRNLSSPRATKRINLPSSVYSDGSGLVYYGVTSGYPGYQGHQFLCLIFAESQILDWNGRSGTSREFRDSIDFDHSFSIKFFGKV
jgi:hypothetical protein